MGSELTSSIAWSYSGYFNFYWNIEPKSLLKFKLDTIPEEDGTAADAISEMFEPYFLKDYSLIKGGVTDSTTPYLLGISMWI